jgi:hypothetical protein
MSRRFFYLSRVGTIFRQFAHSVLILKYAAVGSTVDLKNQGTKLQYHTVSLPCTWPEGEKSLHPFESSILELPSSVISHNSQLALHPLADLIKLRLGDFAMPPKSAVLCPLYIYPLPGAWEPLYSA